MAFSLPAAQRGNTTKGAAYLSLLKSLTQEARHPRHHGVAMQAHHAISQKAIFDANLNDRLEDFGYQIDVANNLVFIPSTLQGACLLQIQPHRGNHTAERIEGPDDDGDHPPKYHIMVANRLKAIMSALEEACGDLGKDMAKTTQKALDKISSDIIRKIQHKPVEARLTVLYPYFEPGNPRGCGGVESVRSEGSDTCPVHRNHTGKHGPRQGSESITYVCTEPYQLRAGN